MPRLLLRLLLRCRPAAGPYSMVRWGTPLHYYYPAAPRPGRRSSLAHATAVAPDRGHELGNRHLPPHPARLADEPVAPFQPQGPHDAWSPPRPAGPHVQRPADPNRHRRPERGEVPVEPPLLAPAPEPRLQPWLRRFENRPQDG